MKRSTRITAAAAFVAAIALGAWQLGGGGRAVAPADRAGTTVGQPQRTVPVTVAQLVVQDVPLQLRLVGRSEAQATVTLRSQIDGQIVSVHFQPGATVQRGQVMFRLDPRMLEAQLAQVRASLARQTAELRLARSERDRQTELIRRGFVSRAQLETLNAAVKTAEALVDAERAALEVAQTQLEHAIILAPIDGIAGAVLSTAGNVVRANDTPLVVINQVDPIQIGFSVPESQLPPIRQAAAAAPLRVDVHVPGNGDRPPIVGELAFIDNQVDVTTGTIRLTALLSNRNLTLTPGQFVEVSLRIGMLRGAVVMPAEALQVGPDGTYVWVVDDERRVDVRAVTIRDARTGIVAVLDGLSAGEFVVTDGQLRLVPGAIVEARPAGPWHGGADPRQAAQTDASGAVVNGPEGPAPPIRGAIP